MRPKKAKELLPQVAEELGLPVKMVEDIHNHYWREVWEQLTSPRSIKVHVTNLGDFNTKHWLLDKEIRKLEAFGDHTKLKGNQRFAAGIRVSEKLQILYMLKEMVEDENQRREFIYEHKRVTHEAKEEEPDTDLEE